MELKIIAVTQARMSSTRLPGKVMLSINGKTLLQMHIDRVKCCKLIDKHIIAISDNTSDDILESYCLKNPIDFFRGNENDVLDRFYKAVQKYNPDIIVRLTADCPLIDPIVISETIQLFIDSKVDYVSNTLSPTYPDGMDVEVFSFASLEKAWKEAELKSDREHVTPYIWRNSSEKKGVLFLSLSKSYNEDFSQYRLTVDEPEDFNLIEKLVTELGTEKTWQEYIAYINKNNLYNNAMYNRNEGYSKSLKSD